MLRPLCHPPRFALLYELCLAQPSWRRDNWGRLCILCAGFHPHHDSPPIDEMDPCGNDDGPSEGG